MATGLIALLDDVAAIAKVAAASIDDAAAQATKASSKAIGIVIDDTAVTPRYVVGFAAERELPIIGKIALGSLRNKLVFLLPICIALDLLAPWAITPLLMIGGAFLCYEAAEKLAEKLGLVSSHGEEAAEAAMDPAELERQKVNSAIRTDMILSAEIMAITLSSVHGQPILTEVFVLAAVAILVTVGVYGLVALIVKADDFGLALARRGGAAATIGTGLVKGMPRVLAVLAAVGTAAMAWVGGGIILHGFEEYGWNALPHAIHHAADVVAAPLGGNAVVHWLVNATGSGIFGIAVGAVIVVALKLFRRQPAHA